MCCCTVRGCLGWIVWVGLGFVVCVILRGLWVVCCFPVVSYFGLWFCVILVNCDFVLFLIVNGCCLSSWYFVVLSGLVGWYLF